MYYNSAKVLKPLSDGYHVNSYYYYSYFGNRFFPLLFLFINICILQKLFVHYGEESTKSSGLKEQNKKTFDDE